MIGAVQNINYAPAGMKMQAAQNFHGEIGAPKLQPQLSSDVFQSEKKDNTVKYAIGAASVLALIGLGIAGYKGKLGKTIQKWLGGAEEVTSQATSASTKGKEKALAVFSDEELKNISGKKIKDLSEDELTKLMNTIIGEDKPVIKDILNKSELDLKTMVKHTEKGETVGQILQEAKAELSVLDENPAVKEILTKLTGKDSILYKKFKDMAVQDFKPFITDMKTLSESIKMPKDISDILEYLDGFEKLPDSLKLIDMLKSINININPEKNGIDLIAQMIRNGYNKNIK